MSNKDHAENRGNDGTETTRHKGESQQSHQKGAKSVAKRDTGKHKRDESDGAEKNTTKKGSNSI
jgi:hypothetical protein